MCAHDVPCLHIPAPTRLDLLYVRLKWKGRRHLHHGRVSALAQGRGGQGLDCRSQGQSLLYIYVDIYAARRAGRHTSARRSTPHVTVTSLYVCLCRRICGQACRPAHKRPSVLYVLSLYFCIRICNQTGRPVRRTIGLIRIPSHLLIYRSIQQAKYVGVAAAPSGDSSGLVYFVQHIGK